MKVNSMIQLLLCSRPAFACSVFLPVVVHAQENAQGVQVDANLAVQVGAKVDAIIATHLVRHFRDTILHSVI